MHGKQNTTQLNLGFHDVFFINHKYLELVRIGLNKEYRLKHVLIYWNSMNEVLMHVKRPNSVNTENGEALKDSPPIHKHYFHSLFRSVELNCWGERGAVLTLQDSPVTVTLLVRPTFNMTGTMLKAFKFISKI